MVEAWSNWSGGVTASPQRIERPTSEDDLREVVRRAARDGLNVRVVGTGHSFTPIVATDGVIVSLDEIQGLVSANREAGRATLWGGTKLHDATHNLWEQGLGLANQGDVDVQSVAGAVGTGTHGTGPAYGNMSSTVVGMRLVTGSGEILECSREKNPEVLRAARVSLGMLGVTSQLTFQCPPRYALHERVWREPVFECLDALDGRIRENDHYEFFWYPRDDLAESKALNPAADQPAAEDPPPLEGPGERVGWSHRIYPSVRSLHFNEMEYSVPAEAGPACFRAVRECMRDQFPMWQWPAEYRTVAADDAMLSPAYGRSTVAISVHQDARRPYEPYFREIETVFRAHGGRPHWAKIHWLGREQLAADYPEWGAFAAIRRSLDPAGRFLSDYLRPLFG
jgi:FAD/FMN-containing dehydrogenase